MINNLKIADAITTAVPTSSTVLECNKSKKTFFAIGTVSAGAGSATVLVQGSNDGGTTWFTLDTLTLTIASSSSPGVDAFSHDAPYQQVKFVVSAISGTDASVDGYVSTES